MVVAGDLDGLDVPALVETALGGWGSGGAERARYLDRRATLARDRSRIVLVSRPGSVQTEIVVGAPGPDRSVEGGWAPYPVLGFVLGGSPNARVDAVLREEKGYTYGIRSSFRPRRAGGLFLTSGSVRADATAESLRLLVELLESGSAGFSDTWPAGRPILDWLLGTMPEGGEGWAQLDGVRDLDDLDDVGALDGDGSALDELDRDPARTRRRELVDQFASSTAATLAGLDLTRDKDRAALALIVGTAGPMPDDEFLRWTPDRVGDLLFGMLPRTLLVDEHIARRIPQLLKAFAVWCLGQADAADRDIAAVRDAVDEFGPDYVGLVTSLEALRLREAVKDYARLLGDPVGIVPVLETTETFDWTEFALDRAAGEVGGRDALTALDAEPLPDEDFDWSVVPADIRGPVTETVGLLDALATERFDVEFRTACRRFLATAVSGDPDIFRRRGSTASAAAVVAWLVGRANGIVARGGDGMTAGDLWAHFGIKGALSRAGRRSAGPLVSTPTPSATPSATPSG